MSKLYFPESNLRCFAHRLNSAGGICMINFWYIIFPVPSNTGCQQGVTRYLATRPTPPTCSYISQPRQQVLAPCSFTGPPGSLSVARSRQAPCQNTRQAPAARRRVQLHAHAHRPVLYKLKPSQVAEIHRFSTN